MHYDYNTDFIGEEIELQYFVYYVIIVFFTSTLIYFSSLMKLEYVQF